nr:MAG TPA: hypothetical protein [Caudoviricetes sp.]
MLVTVCGIRISVQRGISWLLRGQPIPPSTIINIFHESCIPAIYLIFKYC